MQVAQAVLRSTVDIPGELDSLLALQPDPVLVFGCVDLRKSDGQGFDTACVAAVPARFQDEGMPAL